MKRKIREIGRINWVFEEPVTAAQVQAGALARIADNLEVIRGLLQCYRVPAALDALISLKKPRKRKRRAA